ncbi:hypothetical protein R6Q57_002054 [Mikania cordata]
MWDENFGSSSLPFKSFGVAEWSFQYSSGRTSGFKNEADDPPSKLWIGTGKDEGFYQKMVFEGKLAFCHHCNLKGHSPTECRKALAKKTPRLPLASTTVAPKLPLKQATSTSLNPPKAQEKPPQTTWRQRGVAAS